MNLRPAVAWIFINSESKILIASSPRDWWYKFPQWGIEWNEDIITAIKREMKEELWVEIYNNDIEKVGKVSYFFPEWTREIYDGQEQTVFKIFYRESMILEPQDDELGELYRVYPDEVKNFDTRHRRQAYQEALELCGLV